MLRTVTATRYVAPLREGGSLPAIMEAEDGALYVVKFRGAGQGQRALIAELVVGELARALDLPVPEIVLIEVDPALGRSEPDEEINALLMASAGLNLALAFLPGALAFDPLHVPPPDHYLASKIVWFDAFVTNVDRTPRNPNLLIWQHKLWLIDHGAALFMHHTWTDYLQRSHSIFPQIKDHILLAFADDLANVDEELSVQITAQLVEAIIALIPAEWLGDEPRFASVEQHRAAYVDYLLRRVEGPRAFVQEALRARAHRI